MSVQDSVLELLRERGDVISGEEMAERLGISRNSVWKAVRKLRQAEYEIDASTNRGYRLVSESNVLSADNIRRRLEKVAQGVAIDVRSSASSTNTVLKELAEKGGREGMVVIAEHQEQGKGRLGRSFYSPQGGGLYMSVLLRPSFSAEESLAITTAASVAVAQAIDSLTGGRAKIKWVNDVYYQAKKVCGILTEAALDFESGKLNYAVLGIGVNIQAPQGGFPEGIREVAGALYAENAPAGARARLAAEILNRFFAFYRSMPDRKNYMQEYRGRSLLDGMEVTLRQGDNQWEGTVLGVDDQARLLVRLKDGGRRAFGAGEVAIEKNNLLHKLREREEAEAKERERLG